MSKRERKIEYKVNKYLEASKNKDEITEMRLHLENGGIYCKFKQDYYIKKTIENMFWNWRRRKYENKS